MKTGKVIGSAGAMLVCALWLGAMPLAAWAQSAPQQPASPAPQPAAQPPTAAAAPVLSDSARAGLRVQVNAELKRMADSLKLTKEQRDKARPILLEQAYQVKQVRDKYATQARTPANREAMTKEVQVLRDSMDVRLGTVLSAEQLAEWKRMRDARLTQFRSRMPGGMPMKAPADTAAKK